MAFLEKFERFNRRVSSWAEWVAIFGFLLMMAITCVDVIGAKLFRTPVFGSIDVVMITQLVVISFAAAMTLIMGRHIQVEFFLVLLPRRLHAIVDCIMHFFGFALFALIIWRLLLHGFDFQKGGRGDRYRPYRPLPLRFCRCRGQHPGLSGVPATVHRFDH